jgi:hypothetical protein
LGFGHCTVPGCVTPGIGLCSYNGTPRTTLANCGPLPFTMPLPFAEYGELRTENGMPLCQKTVPETCQPFSACASHLF